MDEVINLGRVYWSEPSPDEKYTSLLEENQLLREENERFRQELFEMKKKEKSRLIRKYNSLDEIPVPLDTEENKTSEIIDFQTRKEK